MTAKFDGLYRVLDPRSPRLLRTGPESAKYTEPLGIIDCGELGQINVGAPMSFAELDRASLPKTTPLNLREHVDRTRRWERYVASKSRPEPRRLFGFGGPF